MSYEDAREEDPPFDDTRKALIFALNAHDVKMPKPFMSKAMAEGIKKKVRKSRRTSSSALPEIEQRGSRLNDPRRLRVAPADRPLQAGFILAAFHRMDPMHQVVLSGCLIKSHSPCDCRRPCCSGWAQSLRWTQAVSAMCSILRDLGDDLRKPGKRGLSTQPQLRKLVVESYFRRRAVRLEDLATIAECSLTTAAKHRAWIVDFLTTQENNAWLEADELLNQVGITGTFTD